MNKVEWEDIYSKLERLHLDFLSSYPIYQGGKNKKIRDDARKKVDNAIDLSKRCVQNNSELVSLFVDSEFGNIYAQDEFWQARYFGGDMLKFLSIIQEKIKSFNESD